MFKHEIEQVVAILKNRSIRLEKGMSDAEIKKAEQHYQITFPYELKILLKAVLPVSPHFYNWNNYSIENQKIIKQALNWPIEGLLFDIEYNNLWLEDYWGNAPEQLNEKLLVAKKQLMKMTKLIPIYSHRYIPSLPNQQLAPILSVYQSDIIYYGNNLWNYFEHEFTYINYIDIDFTGIAHIPFWSVFLE